MTTFSGTFVTDLHDGITGACLIGCPLCAALFMQI